jgi:hypothetical protein
MAHPPPPEYGSLLTAILLLLGLGFAGYWIYAYAAGVEQAYAHWFGVAAAVVVVLGIANYVLQSSRS